MKNPNNQAPLDGLIDKLESQARLTTDEWVMDGTSFEQDQHTRQASLCMWQAALHLRSLRASLNSERSRPVGIFQKKKRRTKK